MDSRALPDLICDFDAKTLQCVRCGYRAKTLPFYRACRTISEMAQKIAVAHATSRVSVPPLPVGTAIARGLSAVGITPARVKKVIGKDCGCDKRKSMLDEAGAAVSKLVERGLNGALNFAFPNSVEPEDVAAIANSLQASVLTNAGLKEGPPPSA
jgi:hypothetical protein